MAQPQTVEQLDKIIKEGQEEYKHPSVWGYIIASLIIPPLGLFLSWRAKFLPFVLPTLLMINSVAFGFITAQAFSALNPVLLIITEGYDKPSPISAPLLWSIVFVSIVIGVFGFVAGFYYKLKINKNIISKRLVPILFVTLLLQYLVGLVTLLFVNYSVYQSLESIHF